MKLVFPNLDYKSRAIDFIQEFYDNDSDINGSGALDWYLENSTYEEWLKKILADIDIANIEEPRVPALTYFYVREEDDAIVGMINIRLSLNDFLRNEGGHIGYCIRPSERGQNHASNMLLEGLKTCKTIGIKEVFISCDKENKASARVIIKCGGSLQKEFYSETFDEVIQMYEIIISEKVIQNGTTT